MIKEGATPFNISEIMLKKILQEKGISMYALANETGVPYSTINDLANGKVDIYGCKAGIIKRLSSALGMSMDELYDLCKITNISVETSYGIRADVCISGKKYKSNFIYNDKPVSIELCKINEDTTYYIEYIAKWRTEGYIREKRMADPWSIF